MKYISPSLLAIAAFAAAPCAQALSVKDDDVKLGLNIVIQARAEISDAKSNAGVDYSTVDGTAFVDDADFYIRRARFGMKGTWKDDYTFALIMRADGAGKANATQTMNFYEATVGRKFKSEGSDLAHAIEFGYMAPTFNTASNVHSSSGFLLANEASTAFVMTNRNAGIKYHLSAPWVNFYADIMNNSGDDASSASALSSGSGGTPKDGEGLWTSARIHISPEGEWKMDKPTESWAGKEGKGVLIGLDIARNEKDNIPAAAVATPNLAPNVDPVTSADTLGYGVDLVLHYDGLSFLAEYRVAETETTVGTATVVTTETKAEAWRVQAGYAFPMGDTFVEPAVRISSYDANDKATSTSSFGTNDSGASGDQIELGLNWYLHEHKNKLQLAYTMWEAESGNADASIIRAQWQLSF